MDVAIATVKRMLASNEELTTDNLKKNLDYSNSDYEYTITSYDGGNYVIIKSKNTGKFKNVDFDMITKNAKYTYIGDENGENQIIAKIDDDGTISKISNDDDNDKKFIDSIVSGNDEEDKTEIKTTEEDKTEKYKEYEIGETVVLGKEIFYVIKNNEDTVTAIAKYNLKLESDWQNETYELKQASDNKVYSMAFAKKDEDRKCTSGYLGYWAKSRGEIFDEYKTVSNDYPVDVYNKNSNLYEPLQKYKTYLEGLGKKIQEIRPITYIELVDLGCSKKDCKNSNKKWLYNSKYWTASAYWFDSVHTVGNNGVVSYISFYSNNDYAGIRPVIEINKSEL